ncbi:39S ribosomal protein L52, mitochondrial, partial [Dufourea novaeangliae]
TTTISGFHTSSVTHLNQDWRAKKKLHSNPYTCGPLVNLPDYSFKDNNKPVPYGINQLKRIRQHQEYAKRVVHLAGEIDGALERYNRLQNEKERRKQQIIDNKLKPKGQLLITDK